MAATARPLAERAAAADARRNQARDALTVVEGHGAPSLEERCARHLARRATPMTPEELSAAFAIRGAAVTADAVRAVLASHPAFTQDAQAGFTLGRPASIPAIGRGQRSPGSIPGRAVIAGDGEWSEPATEQASARERPGHVNEVAWERLRLTSTGRPTSTRSPNPPQYPVALADLRALEAEVSSAGLSGFERWSLTFTLSSVMINLASDAGSTERPEDWAWSGRPGCSTTMKRQTSSFRRPNTTGPPAWRRYSRSRRRTADEPRRSIVQPCLPACTPGRSARSAHAVSQRAEADLLAPSEVRGRALCNLGNLLDESGRWVEAYSAYSDALQADPTNGNAAGNIAELLRRRLGRRVDQRGHLAAVYDHYVAMAQSLRERTIELAGVAAADRWDALELTGSRGHLRHAGDQLDPYQCWIVRHRLALVASVEGLGSDSAQWDTASVAGVVRAAGEPVPGIFGALNVLKAEFLVARRLAFRGEQMHAESGGRQHPDDPGLYTDTLDGAFYGEAPALLLLAQRSRTGRAGQDRRHRQRALQLRAAALAGRVLELLEGSQDRADPSAAGARRRRAPPPPGPGRTRRPTSVMAGCTPAPGCCATQARTGSCTRPTAEPTGPTRDTFSTVNMRELQTATLEALQVVRAAYLYFVDLIDSQLAEASETASICSLRNQH